MRATPSIVAIQCKRAGIPFMHHKGQAEQKGPMAPTRRHLEPNSDRTGGEQRWANKDNVPNNNYASLFETWTVIEKLIYIFHIFSSSKQVGSLITGCRQSENNAGDIDHTR